MAESRQNVPEEDPGIPPPGYIIATTPGTGGALTVTREGNGTVPQKDTACETLQVEASRDAGRKEAVEADAAKPPEAADATASEPANAGGGCIAAVAAAASPLPDAVAPPSPAAR